MSQELNEVRLSEDPYSMDIDQKAEKDEIAKELFDEINEIITLLVATFNTGR